jgi:hypothetical protein
MVFITLLFTSGYYDLVKKNYALSEIQSMLDVAGTAVLEAVIGNLYENGDLVVSGSGPIADYATANDAPFGTSGNPNTSIKKVIIKDGVTTVGNWAFSRCFSLASITIPDSVTSIGNWAFSGCSGLTKVYFEGNAPTYGTNIFQNTPSTLKVYRKSVATGWPSVGANWGTTGRATALWENETSN